MKLGKTYLAMGLHDFKNPEMKSLSRWPHDFLCTNRNWKGSANEALDDVLLAVGMSGSYSLLSSVISTK